MAHIVNFNIADDDGANIEQWSCSCGEVSNWYDEGNPEQRNAGIWPDTRRARR